MTEPLPPTAWGMNPTLLLVAPDIDLTAERET